MASYASLSLAWSELGSAPEAIRSCYGWPPLYKSVLGARMQEKLRSVHMAPRIASATSKAIAQAGLGGPQPLGSQACDRSPCALQGWLKQQLDSCLG